MGDPFISELFLALQGAVDADKLEGKVRALCGSSTAAPSSAILSRLSMADLLDESILGARPDDKSFPLRVLFGEISGKVDTDDEALALASGLNFYFRAKMEEDARVSLGSELSRAYYTFTANQHLERDLVTRASPLLAALLSTEVSRVRFESVDHTSTFDSQVHERAREASPSSSRIVRPATFLCRVAGNNMVRAKAQVIT